MTAGFWLSTAQTVTFLAATAWAWWATARITELLNATDTIRAHAEAMTQQATRAALDARAMLDAVGDESAILREWWAAHADPTPQPAAGPDTVPEAQAIRLVDDLDLAWELARLEQIMRQPAKKPAPRKRTG